MKKDKVNQMTRKKEKVREKRYISKGMSLIKTDKESKKIVKKRERKPKMPARIKSIPRNRHKKR